MAFPAFAQQLYAFPIDATGKAVCANCHLAEAPIRLSGPSAHQHFPCSCPITGWSISLLRGTVSGQAQGRSLQHFPCSSGTKDGRNRGRGQLYPDGSPSNNGGFRSLCNGWLGRVHISREGPSLGLWTRQAAVQVSKLPAGVDILARRSCQLGARISIDAVLASNPNVGGVGQSEALLVLQSRERLGYYVQVVAAIAATQLALVLKKKQYERFRLGQDGRSLVKA